MMPFFLTISLCILAGYVLGSFSMSHFLAKQRGVEIREKGSGNAGASNAAIVLGVKAAVIVALFDILKGTLAVLLAKVLSGGNGYCEVSAGTVVVLGHIFPFYLGFRGGKGFAALLGTLLAYDWRFFLILAAIGLVLGLLSDYIVVYTMFICGTVPLFLGVTPYIGWANQYGLWCALIACAASGVMVFKHLENFRKIRNGTEFTISGVLRKKG